MLNPALKKIILHILCPKFSALVDPNAADESCKRGKDKFSVVR